MSKTDMNSIVLMVIIIAISCGIVVAYGYMVSVIPTEYEGFLANILYGLDQFLENPVIVGWITSIIVAGWGWLENYTQTGEQYDPKKFAETICFYEPALILISQYFPMPYAVFIAFGIDVARRIAKRIK